MVTKFKMKNVDISYTENHYFRFLIVYLKFPNIRVFIKSIEVFLKCFSIFAKNDGIVCDRRTSNFM